MSSSLLVLFGSHGPAVIDRARMTGSVAHDWGFRPRVVDLNHFAPANLGLEDAVLFLLAPPMVTGVFDLDVSFWQGVVRQERFDFTGVNFSVLTLGSDEGRTSGSVGQDLERALVRQQARLAFPRMDCPADDETSFRVWLCGALAALKMPRSNSRPPRSPTTEHPRNRGERARAIHLR